MADPKDAFGRTVSRRSFLSMAAVAGAAVAGGGLLAGCGGGTRWRQPAPAVQVVEALVGATMADHLGPLGPTRARASGSRRSPRTTPSSTGTRSPGSRWWVTTSPSSSRSSPAVAPPMRSTSVTAIWRSSSRVASWRTSPHSSRPRVSGQGQRHLSRAHQVVQAGQRRGLVRHPGRLQPQDLLVQPGHAHAAGVSTNPALCSRAAPGTRPRWTTC